MAHVPTPTPPSTARISPSTLGAYLGMAAAWGASFLLIKISLEQLSPGQVVVGRLASGGATLVVLVVLTRRRWPREAWLWAHLAVVSVLLCVAPFLLFSWAGQHLPSGLSAILNATTPIWTAVATAAAVPAARLRAPQIAGIVIGTIGVSVVMGVWRVVADPAFAASLPAQLACLAATACYGAGFAWLRRNVTGRHDHDPLIVAAVQIGLAAVLALALAPLIARGPWHVDSRVLVSMALLGCVSTGFAYVWSMRVVAAWGPVPASTVTYLTPLVGVVLGIIVLDESLSWHEPVGAVIVCAGVVLAQRR